MTTPSDILDFWFSDRVKPHWYAKNPVLDAEIRTHFESIYEEARAGKNADWRGSAEGVLALIILFDQFSRNMHRGSMRSFENDDNACELADMAISRGFDQQLSVEQRHFLYLPFMHCERVSEQNRSVALFSLLGRKEGIDFAMQHRAIITRFGRFPHRNVALGRTSSSEELEFLKEHPGF